MKCIRFTGLFLMIFQYSYAGSAMRQLAPRLDIFNAHDFLTYCMHNPTQMRVIADHYISMAQTQIARILEVAPEMRTFANTAQALDHVCELSEIATMRNMLKVVDYVSPNDAVRKAAQENLNKIKAFFVDQVYNNRAVYKAFSEYVQNNASKEQLRADQQYFLDKTMERYKRNGIELSEAQLSKVKELSKEINAVGMQYLSNIAQDNTFIQVSYEELAGLGQDFINRLKKEENGDYVLGVDYPTFFEVMENCSVESTRKKLFLAFENRAYPQNEPVLKALIAKRDAVAKELGYSSYADYDLENQMARTVQRVHDFIQDLLPKTQVKMQQEFDQLVADLPAGITLIDGKLKRWDYAYVKTQYKKKNLQVDEHKVSEYFPAQKTIAQLFKIYEQFFSIAFKEVAVSHSWHADVKKFEVYDKNNQLIGYLYLDLHPRPNKFSHACCESLVAASYKDDKIVPGAAIVITNFPKASDDAPSLLKYNDVATFFHELGHALHAILGRTHIASFSGMKVATDFLEMPSQMLEEWIADFTILKSISSHYQSGNPMPDELIHKIVALQQFDCGNLLQDQLYKMSISLELFKEGAYKNPYEIVKKIINDIRINFAFEPKAHYYTAFCHLPDYGAKCYCYLWSQVFAMDLFQEIKKQGLLNPVIGQKYVEQVIGKGGSEDPNSILKNFLGRDPNPNAFLESYGISETKKRKE